MPHVYVDRETYAILPRTTEIISVLECKAKASFHPVHTRENEWYEMANYVALKGTLGHHKIENDGRELMGLPPLKLELSAGDQILYNEVKKNPQARKWVKEQVDIAYQNYLDWFEEFNPIPIAVEKSMVYVHIENGKIVEAKSCKGTIDFICVLDPELMSEEALKIFPITEPCTVLIDWKTGVAKMPIYQAQIEGYKWLLNVTGEWEKMVRTGQIKYPFAKLESDSGREYPAGMTVLLGGKKFKCAVYDLSSGLFKQARELFFVPEPLVISEIRGGRLFREGYHCVFCTYRDTVCPIFSFRTANFYDEVDQIKLKMVNKDD
jgi:hypothetical protein